MGMNEIGLQNLTAELELDIERHRWGASCVAEARSGGVRQASRHTMPMRSPRVALVR